MTRTMSRFDLPHAVRVMDLKFSQWPGWILFDGQRGVNLDDGGVHVFEGFAGKSAAGLLEQDLGGAQLGIGSGLGFTPPPLAADFAAEFLDGQFDLLHGPDAMPLVVVVGLGEGCVGVIQHGDAAGLGLHAGHEAKSQENGGEKG